jgi:hypothetical protein
MVGWTGGCMNWLIVIRKCLCSVSSYYGKMAIISFFHQAIHIPRSHNKWDVQIQSQNIKQYQNDHPIAAI